MKEPKKIKLTNGTECKKVKQIPMPAVEDEANMPNNDRAKYYEDRFKPYISNENNQESY